MPRQRYQMPTVMKTTGKNSQWYIRPWVDVITSDGELKRQPKRIYLGPIKGMGKRQAEGKRNQIMATVNKADYVIQSQIRFDDFLDHYERAHVLKEGNLAASTQQKYLTHIRNHIRPAFRDLMLCEVNTERIDAWLTAKAKSGLSWATRNDLRNILSNIFTKADDWGYHQDRNPVQRVSVGRKRAVREKRKLPDEQVRLLLATLPEDVGEIIEMALFLTLRISEIFGLQEKHLDFTVGTVLVRQRYYRGDLDEVKNQRSARDIRMGYLVERLKRKCTGDPERFVFWVKTKRGACRDDRDINQHFLRPAAKALGIYYPGFGFHAFRREAITALSADSDPFQAMRTGGHSKADMSLLYTLTDSERQEKAIRQHQERIFGIPEGGPIQ